MASMILSGDTSGAITVSAPAVAGTNTITFPANTGTVLTTASTFSGTGPAFHAFQTNGQSISASVFTKVTFNNETFDTNNNFASSTFTPTVAGYYQINGNISFIGNAVGFTMIAIYKNNGSYCQGSGIPNNVNIGGQATASTVVFCNGTTDFIELYAWQNSGSSLAFQTANDKNTFSAVLVRAA
jgi:hypothetical protein